MGRARELDRLLTDDTLFAAVVGPLQAPPPNSGGSSRHSTPVEVILRMLVLRRLYDWATRYRARAMSDSLVLRQFARCIWSRLPTTPR